MAPRYSRSSSEKCNLQKKPTPVTVFVTPSWDISPDPCPFCRPARAYVLSRGGRAFCIYELDSGEVVAEGDYTVLDEVMKNPNPREVEALRVFFPGYVPPREQGVVVSLRGHAWLVTRSGIRYLGRGAKSAVRDPLHFIVSRLPRGELCILGVGLNIMICSGMRCRCYPLKPIADLVARKLGIECIHAASATRTRRGWLVETKGKRHWTECTPKLAAEGAGPSPEDRVHFDEEDEP